MNTCAFCRIADHAEPANLVLDTEDALGFLDIHPLFKGHVLVIPREHHVTLPDLPPAQVGPFFAAVQRVSAALPGSSRAMEMISSRVYTLHLRKTVVLKNGEWGIGNE